MEPTAVQRAALIKITADIAARKLGGKTITRPNRKPGLQKVWATPA